MLTMKKICLILQLVLMAVQILSATIMVLIAIAGCIIFMGSVWYNTSIFSAATNMYFLVLVPVVTMLCLMLSLHLSSYRFRYSLLSQLTSLLIFFFFVQICLSRNMFNFYYLFSILIVPSGFLFLWWGSKKAKHLENESARLDGTIKNHK